jgi:large subunit ribosomal protein L10
MVFVKDDPIAASKIIVNFIKEHEALQIRGGFMAERVITSGDIKAIAKLSSRQALYSAVASVLNAPIAKLAMSLNQIIAKLAYALKAVAEKKK